MRIAIFTDTFFPQRNGVVTALLNLAEGMADKGHKVFIIAPKLKGAEYQHKNITVVRCGGVPALFYPEFKFTSIYSRRIIKLLRKERVDIIHFMTPVTLGAMAIFTARKLHVPLVSTFHTFIADDGYLRHVRLGSALVTRFTWNYLIWFCDACDLVTSPSSNTRKELLRHGCKSPVKVISNGMSFSGFGSVKTKEYQRKYGKNTILFVGRMAHEKSVDLLLVSFAKVVKKVPDAKLLLVGDGPQKDALIAQAKSLGLQNKAIFLGSMPAQEVYSSGIYRAVKMFATCSSSENQPMTVLEAQANGLPCVVVDALGMPDLVDNGDTGFLVKPKDTRAFADAIVTLLRDERLRANMSANASRAIKKHHLPRVIATWERTYAALQVENRRRLKSA